MGLAIASAEELQEEARRRKEEAEKSERKKQALKEKKDAEAAAAKRLAEQEALKIREEGEESIKRFEAEEKERKLANEKLSLIVQAESLLDDARKQLEEGDYSAARKSRSQAVLVFDQCGEGDKQKQRLKTMGLAIASAEELQEEARRRKEEAEKSERKKQALKEKKDAEAAAAKRLAEQEALKIREEGEESIKRFEAEERERKLSMEKEALQTKQALDAKKRADAAAVKKSAEEKQALEERTEQARTIALDARGKNAAMQKVANTETVKQKAGSASPRSDSNVDIYRQQAVSGRGTQRKTENSVTFDIVPDADQAPRRKIARVPTGIASADLAGKAETQSLREKAQKGPAHQRVGTSQVSSKADQPTKPLTFNPDVEPLTVDEVIGHAQGLWHALFSPRDTKESSPPSSEATFRDFVNTASPASSTVVAPTPSTAHQVPPSLPRRGSATRTVNLWDDSSFRSALQGKVSLYAQSRPQARASPPPAAVPARSRPAQGEKEPNLFRKREDAFYESLAWESPKVAAGQRSRAQIPSSSSSGDGGRAAKADRPAWPVFAQHQPIPEIASPRHREPNLFAAREQGFYERLAGSAPTNGPGGDALESQNVLLLPLDALTLSLSAVT